MNIGLIFDIDGTLWDATDTIAVSYNRTAERMHGIRPSITGENLRALFGREMHEIGERLFPELSVNAAHDLIDQCTADENLWLLAAKPEPYPGVRETLRSLSEKYPLYIVSNCAAGYPEAFLEATGTAAFFSGHLCPDDTGCGKADNIRILMEKEHLDKGVYIGDLDLDYQAARKAGADFIHASYGFGKIPDKVPEISSFRELLLFTFPLSE